MTEQNPSLSDRTLRRPDAEQTLRRPELGSPPDDPPHARFLSRLAGEKVSLEVVRLLARSGEGDLYLCRCGDEARIVKILNTDSDYEVLEAFVSKADLLSAAGLMPLEHIGRMTDMDPQAADERRYIVSPWYENGDMSSLPNMQRINPGIHFNGPPGSFGQSNAEYARVQTDFRQVDLPAFQELLSQLLHALMTLHGPDLLPDHDGIIHRDIRPQNILVRRDGSFILGDYGLVSALDRGLAMKFTERFGLSHGYSPPEAYGSALLRQRVTRKYDYFSLGMTLLHILSGRPAYLLAPGGQDPENYESTLDEFYEAASLGNIEIPPDLPARIRNLLAGLLTPDPNDRWGAEEVASWLQGKNPVVHTPEVLLDSGIYVKLNRKVYQGEREVAQAIISEWVLFRDLLAAGNLEFHWRDPDLAFRKRVDDALAWARERRSDPDTGLLYIVRTLWPKAGHVVAGRTYAADTDLGHAMLRAGQDEQDPERAALLSYLSKGALSALAPESPDTLRQIEQLAAARPSAALLLAGCALSGEAPPAGRVSAGGAVHTFTSLRDFSDLLVRLTAEAVDRFLQNTEYAVPEHSPVPGVYSSADGGEICVVQADGTILGNTDVYRQRLETSGELEDVVRWAAGSSAFSDVSQLNDLLYTHLWYEGAVDRSAPAAARTEVVQEAHAGLTLQSLALFLLLFPAFRLGESLSVLDPYFERIRLLMDRVAPVYLPDYPSPGSDEDPMTAAIWEVRERTQQWLETRRPKDFVRACSASARCFPVLEERAPCNRTASMRVISAFVQASGAGDPEASAVLRRIFKKHAPNRTDPGNLQSLAADLMEYARSMDTARETNLRPYMLAKEMDYLRTYSRTTGSSSDFVLPDTTNAAEYYAAVQVWAREHRARTASERA